VSVDIDLIGCPEWEAPPPRNGIDSIEWTDGPAKRFICHHTAGHHPELGEPLNESREESIRYAHQIRDFHVYHNGWNDSGHNFLVCRNGLILQGRWRTIRAIQAGRMVVSAHCPGQNEQIGIEFEHLGTEAMTWMQREAGARLMAWCCDQYDRKTILPMEPHQKYFATSCPANLIAEIPRLVLAAQTILDGETST
jgi:N-acetylmuramoyl-L-alanine amidase